MLRVGDVVICDAGDLIPGDGEVIEGIATVDESVITGESAPVIRESGGDRSAVTGGTSVLSDQIKIKITSNPGETFLDRMIALVEGAERQKTPNEIALNILIAGLTLIFLLAVITLQPFSVFSVAQAGSGSIPTRRRPGLAAGLPDPDDHRRPAFRHRHRRHGSRDAAQRAGHERQGGGSRRRRELAAARQDRHHHAGQPAGGGVPDRSTASRTRNWPMPRSCPAWPTKRRKAGPSWSWRKRSTACGAAISRSTRPTFIPFSAYTRMSGVDFEGRQLRKGATDAIIKFVIERGGEVPGNFKEMSDRISRNGGTPLAVCDGKRLLGVIHLKDIVKGGMKERIAQLRQMGIRSIMITGDNPLTAAAIAAEAGVDDFLAQATPKDKLEYIKKEQAAGRLVAMTGDGTNDAPALAQADVGLAMNTGTTAAKEAGNMVDLDSNPTKLIEVVAIGKQLLITRGALTTFSIANDVAKYFAIIPAMFMTMYPVLGKLNIMGLHTPQSAVLAAVIFNALIIIALVPLALRGVKYRPVDAASLLRRNLLIYGVGGIIAPFPGIWIIDQLLVALRLA